MFKYKIAGLNISIDTNNKYLIKRLAIFEANWSGPADISISIKVGNNKIEMPAGELVIDNQVLCLKKLPPAKGFYIVRYEKDADLVKGVMDVDENWCNINIHCLDIKWDEDILYPETISGSWTEHFSFQLVGIAFRYHILKNEGVVIHSSSISFNNQGMIFTAPSGTGKSTHVRLWETYVGNSVSVINDDSPVIRFVNDIPYICGTPWSGSSDRFLNLEVPLKGIVVLQQASENSIRRLNLHEALINVMPRLFMPHFDENLMGNVYRILDMLLLKVPVYLLACRPDKEAMEMSYQCLEKLA